MRKSSLGEAARFLVAGAVNTLATYLLYLFLLPMLGYSIAYTVAYVCGILLAYVLGVRFTFRVRPRVRNAVLFPLVYVIQYLAGIVLLVVFVEVAHMPERFAPLAVIAATLPLTFLASRLILTGGSSGRSKPLSGDPT